MIGTLLAGCRVGGWDLTTVIWGINTIQAHSIGLAHLMIVFFPSQLHLNDSLFAHLSYVRYTNITVMSAVW